MVETQLAENASVRRPPSPRSQRAVGPQASEGIDALHDALDVAMPAASNGKM